MKMITVDNKDKMMIRATMMGTVVADFCSTGFTCVNDVIREVFSRVECSGIVEVSLRNASQGWSTRQALYV